MPLFSSSQQDPIFTSTRRRSTSLIVLREKSLNDKPRSSFLAKSFRQLFSSPTKTGDSKFPFALQHTIDLPTTTAPTSRRLALSLSSLVTEDSNPDQGMVSITSMKEIRALANELENENGHERRNSAASSFRSVFDTSSTPSRTSRSSIDSVNQAYNPIHPQPLDKLLDVELHFGPNTFSPALSTVSEGLLPGKSLSALPMYVLGSGLPCLEPIKGLEFVAEEWEPGQESELRSFVEKKLSELLFSPAD